MDCFLTELKNKEVINITSGKRLGYVSDIELDICDARLVSIIIPGEGGLFSKAPCIKIPWACIEHIGEDLIIVKMKDPVPKN
ncbi:MAG: YlmC/YmxH family sporulation protein [Ruminococcaceae bacterium]|nr:YlmC/YmxH family sporulation protein [Oscillospiraceae bacterium]